jgi:PAS domain S-box-containing protein
MAIATSERSAAAGWLPEELETPLGTPGLLSALFEGNPDMVIVTDSEGRIVAANPSAVAGFGYNREELEGQSTSLLLPESVRERHQGHVQAFQKHGTVRMMGSGMNLRARHAHGEEFAVDVMLHPFTAGNSRYTLAVCRRLDAALERSQMQVHALVESVRDYAINLLDAQGRILTWNEGSRRIHGMTASEALGQNFSIFFTAEDIERGEPQRLLEETARNGHCRTEGWRVCSHGSPIWGEIDYTVIRDSAGQVTGFTRVLHDMTAHKQADEALRQAHQAVVESEERFRLLVAPVKEYAIYMLDTEGRVMTWNEGAERSKGYKAEEVIGRNFSMFFLPEDVEAGVPAEELATALREGRFEREGWRMRKDGTRFWALVTLTAIHAQDGTLRGYAKVTRDMTAQKEAAETMRLLNAQLERYRIMVESIEDYAIYTLDANGVITSWGTGARKVSGYGPEEVLGRHCSIFDSPGEEGAGESARELAETARTGRYAVDRWRALPNGTRVWSSGAITAVRDEAGQLTGFIRVARDMTKQKLLEESLQRLTLDLEDRVAERTRQLESTVLELRHKNEEVEAFVYIVSHDLRAPLVNVMGFSRELEWSCSSLKTLLEGMALPEESSAAVFEILDVDLPSSVHFISQSSLKFERLIDALLSLSRHGRQIYTIEDVDVDAVVANTVATLQRAIGEADAEVEIGRLPRAAADTTALGQVFSNLVGNCIKYRSPERRLKVEIGGQIEDQTVRYWVGDNGLGIPEAGKARLFQVFQRFHPHRAEGEGMGLAIAHRIVERHGGKIWAESREGGGTIFNFTLPSRDGFAGAENSDARSARKGAAEDGNDSLRIHNPHRG